MIENKSKQLNSYLWVEKYRPSTLDQIILPETYIKQMKKLIKDKEIPNLLLAGSYPGSGKTTLAKILCNEIDMEYLYINISIDNGIDTLRSTIQNFATIKSINKKPKCVIMDEMDGASDSLQKALRGFIEEYHKTCRFIFTCNYIKKIIPALQEGRTQVLSFDFSDKIVTKDLILKVCYRIFEILDNEQVTYDKKIIGRLVKKNYPNIRSIITKLQQYSSMNGNIIDENILNSLEADEQLFDLIINKQLDDARKLIIDKSYQYEQLYSILFKNFVPLLEKNKRPNAYILLADYSYRHSFVIDPEINFTALLVELMQL